MTMRLNEKCKKGYLRIENPKPAQYWGPKVI